MIPRVFAIALLAIRAAIRSRMVLTLAALLLLALAGLPGWIRGDGTAQGTFTLLVGHTLGVCFFLLAATSLWAGCAAVAAERSAGTATLTVVKPVRPIELWLGKWLGIVVLNAVLLGAVVVGLRLQILIRAPTLPDDWRRCDRVVPCILPDPIQEAEQALQTLRAEGRLLTNSPVAKLRADLIQEARMRYTLIQPGEKQAWRFRLPRHATGIAPTVRAVFETQYGLHEESALTLYAQAVAPSAAEAPFEVHETLMAGEPLLRALPPFTTDSGGLIEVAFQLDPGARSPLFLHPGRNLALLLPDGSFGRNLACAALLLLAVLAALAACGLALGCCFSFPVASFAAVVLILLALLGSRATADAADLTEASGLGERFGMQVVRCAGAVTQPLLSAAPITQLTRREAIPLRSLAQPLGIGFIAVPALLACISASVLKRRENGA
jgi:hypothetical protein